MNLKARILAGAGVLMVAVAGLAVPAQAAQPVASVRTAAVTPDGSPFTVGKVQKKAAWSSADALTHKKIPNSGGVSTQARTSCTNPCYLYEGGRQDFTAPNKATSVVLNVRVKKPFLDYTNDAYHSLQETAVLDPASGSNRNIVEVGWTVDPAVNGGSYDPFLFTFAWVGGAGQGYNAAGGFIDNGSCSLNAGASLAYDISTTSPTSKWAIQWDGPSSPASDGWWISYTDQTAGVNCWVGYYPQTLWSNAGQTFVDASRVDNFLEIAAKRTEPCSDFGSGDPASTGTPVAAAATSVTINPIGSAGTSLTTYSIPTVTNPAIKSVQFASAATTRSIYFGGRGWNALGTGGGTKGSC